MSKRKQEEEPNKRQLKKQRRKERKEALNLQDITPDATPTNTETRPTPVHEAEHETLEYQTHADLEALPQTDIDKFYSSLAIRVDDPAQDSLRPIIDFAHLPSGITAQFSSIYRSFDKPSTIQSSAWPYLLSGRDVVGVAETGSGKTLAFGLPLVVRLAQHGKKKGVRALIVAPTRELAIQVFEQIEKVCQLSTFNLKAAVVYGGSNKVEQRQKLEGANVIVGTPGRLKDFMSDGSVDISKTRYLVLDEADRMLDKGFEDDIKEIIKQMPDSTKRQTAMFTATWPKSIRELAATFMREPVRITIGRTEEEDSGELKANPRIKQVVEVMDGRDKQNRLLQLLKQHNPGKKTRTLVFCLYKKEALRIENFIKSRGYDVKGLHGDMSQSNRVASLEAFKSGQVNLLVATDVAARGLDIPNVALVINVTFPLTGEDYVHRIGRTGRAGKEGLSITFFTEQDKGLAGALVNVLKSTQQEVPEDLLRFGTTVKKKAHSDYGAFYRENEDGKKATKITFEDSEV